MKITGKIQPYALALGIWASFLTESAVGRDCKEYATPQEAVNVLKSPIETITGTINGYKTLKKTLRDLKNLSGIINGTIEVKKIDEKYKIEGDYNENNPDALQKILELADENCDKIITQQEARKLEDKLYKEYSK